MISLTQLDGRVFALNADLVERIDPSVDGSGAVVTLVDGGAYAVAESLTEVVESVRRFRASLVALSGSIQGPAAAPGLRIVTDSEGH